VRPPALAVPVLQQGEAGKPEHKEG
jgi:hypothetical protein